MGIKFEKVSFTYPSETKEVKYAVKDISLEIEQCGEFIALIGQTGSGKSTLVQLMNALIRPVSGKATIYGIKIPNATENRRKVKLNELRRNIGLVFQFPEYQLFEETVEKDIIFGPKNFGVSMEEAKKRAKEMIHLVGLDESYLTRSPFSLSGGEKKRVSIAGILAMEPDVLVLDEPTSGLDPMGRDMLLKLFYKIHKEMNKTIVIITHDMNIVQEYCDRVIVMNKGSKVFDGTPISLFEHPSLTAWNLDLPDIVKIMKKINESTNQSVHIYPRNIEEAVLEIRGTQHE